MKKTLTLLFILLGISMTSFAQTNNWTGTTDNNWDEPTNWSFGTVPAAGEKVQINTTVTITGTNPGRAVPGRIRVFAAEVVTLDLDLTLAGVSGISQAIQLNNGGTLNLGDGVTPRTFTISTSSTSAIVLNNGGTNLVVAANSIVNMTGAVSSILVAGSGDVITNNGTINITGYSSVGILVQGSGTIENNGTIDVSAPSAAASDGVRITNGIFNNSGILNSATGAGAGANDNPLSVEGGTFDNKSTGVVNVSCDDATPRGAVLVSSGSLLNSGKLNADSGGNTNRRILATGTGSITNNVCGIIDMGNGRYSSEGGGFTNNGLLITTKSNSSITRVITGSAINNGFAISGGTDPWTGTENGLTLASGATNFVVDAASSCTVSDIGIDVAHDWYSDVGMTTLVGANDAAGMLTINTGALASGTHTLYSCYGNDVTMTVDDVNCLSTLPIELMSFKGVRKDDNVELTWVTASEENNYGFEVERAYKNGAELEWRMIDFVEGSGTTQASQTYLFTDRSPEEGINYYRLKQMDFDDKHEYSFVIAIEFSTKDGSTSVGIFPNPAKEQLTIINGEGKATIYNVLGQPVKHLIIDANQTTVQLADLLNGQYYLQVRQEYGTIITKQFSKVN